MRKDRDFKFRMILLSTPFAHLGLFCVIKQQISNIKNPEFYNLV